MSCILKLDLMTRFFFFFFYNKYTVKPNLKQNSSAIRSLFICTITVFNYI